MKLEHLGQNFSCQSQEVQRAFFLSYSERRAIDLASPTTMRGQKPSTAKKKGKNLKVSSESLEILKKLGLVS